MSRLHARSIRVLLVLVVVAVTAGVLMRLALAPASQSESSTRTAASAFVDTRCADLIVLGVRGSGQSRSHNVGVGGEVLGSVRAMVARLHATSDVTVRLQAVDYRAAMPATIASYSRSVDDGRRELAASYHSLSKECTDSRFALVGFSQGAQAIHEFTYDLSKEKARPIALVGLIADPRRNATDSIAHWSYGERWPALSARLGAGPEFGPGLRKTAITFCIPQDEVCNTPTADGAATVSSAHRTFYERDGAARSTGAKMHDVLRRNGVGRG